MFCPECGGEYRSGFTRCVDCGVALTAWPPRAAPAEEPHPADLVTVFSSSNPALIPLAKSLLESAGIEFTTKGEFIQDWIGWGRFPAGVNVVTGPIEFQVDSGNAEEARELLRDLEKVRPIPGPVGVETEEG